MHWTTVDVRDTLGKLHSMWGGRGWVFVMNPLSEESLNPKLPYLFSQNTTKVQSASKLPSEFRVKAKVLNCVYRSAAQKQGGYTEQSVQIQALTNLNRSQHVLLSRH